MLAELVRPARDASRALVPNEFDGFRIVRPLGRGGSGQVFLADEPALARQVAVKVLDAGADESWLAEARVVGRLRHPGLVALYRVGVVGARPYLVYELVPGVPLSSATIPMLGRRVAHIARDVSSALTAVHAAGIVHGDVKPSNIMLAPDPIHPGEENARLIDFGIAHPLDRQPNVRSGTPRYMAPEVLRGGRATPRSDTYSLALVVLELLTGGLDPQALDALPRSTRSSAWIVSPQVIDAVRRTLSAEAERRLEARDLYAVVTGAASEDDSRDRSRHPRALPWDPAAFDGVDLGPVRERMKTAGSAQTLWSPKPWLICARQEGLLDTDVARVLIHEADLIGRRGAQPWIFTDAREAAGQTPGYRNALSAWSQRSLATLGEMHVLSGARASSVGRIRVHTDPSSFSAAFRAALSRSSP